MGGGRRIKSSGPGRQVGPRVGDTLSQVPGSRPSVVHYKKQARNRKTGANSHCE